MENYLGYTRPVKTDQLASSDNLIIDMGQGRVSLVQQFQASFEHDVQLRYEMGSSTAYFNNGRPIGALSVGTLIGRAGILKTFDGSSAACGELKAITISLDGGPCAINAGPGRSFRNAKLRSVSMQGQANNFDLAESAEFVVADMM